MNKNPTRLVVIGNGMAGMATVEAILKTKSDLSITIFGDEAQTHYNRIFLSDVLAGKTTGEKIILHSESWYAKNEIDLRQGVKVVSINPKAKQVSDSEGTVTDYDSLLLATGGSPTVPPIAGSDKEGVFVFWTMKDTEKIIAAARSNREAVVIGGGLLGLEAARGLINYGVSVTVVHLGDRLMEQQLDTIGASILRRDLERMGIPSILNMTADKIMGDKPGDNQVSGVRLKSGETLPAGMVLICTGTRPNLSLAKEAGLKVNEGIVVDDRMETSRAGIFAVGDAIEHRGKVYGLVTPLKEQAEVVADAIAGKNTKRYEGTVCATTLKVAGINLTSAGDFTGGGGAEEVSFVDSEKSIYKKCVIRQNRLTGFILLGDNTDGPRLFNLLQKGEDISAIKNTLLGNIAMEGAPDSLSGVASLAESDLVCTCYSVSKGAICSAIREKGLKTRDEVAGCTDATTGCGSCAQLVNDLLDLVNKPSQQKGSATAPPSLVRKSRSGSLKTLDLEKIKQGGLGLDFSRIREEGTRALSPEDGYRLKTYGICTQKHEGYSMMRIRIPGGIVTSEQVTQLASLAEVHGRGRIHLSVRQALELHWVRVEEAETIFAKLKSMGLTSRSACGHTMRNVTACTLGSIAQDGLIDVQPWARQISDYFIKRSDLINPTMPNRLNINFSACGVCAADAMINDIAFVAVKRETEGGSPKIGFEFWVGGSLGSRPLLGFRLREFIPLADALPACQAVFEIHVKFGNRSKAKSRLKFLIKEWGQEKFIKTFDKIFQEKQGLPENREVCLPTMADVDRRPWSGGRLAAGLIPAQASKLPSGAIPQRQRGYVRLAVAVPLGDIRAETFAALGEIAKQHGNGRLHFTKDQDVELQWIPARKIRRVAKILEQLGLSLKGKANGPNLIACVGIEFCTLAVTHSQGAARELLNHHNPADPEKRALFNALSIHISGCPNSCAKHQVGDIGLAGSMSPVGASRRFSYQLFLGGSLTGNFRLGKMVRKAITEEMVVPTVDALLDIALAHRHADESFQEVISRLGTDKVMEILEEKIKPFVPEASEVVAMTPELMEIS
ncbi:MAG: FAD-dependent oxidoreductase [Nitrospira sp.]